MKRRPPRSTLTDTLFPYTTLFRSVAVVELPGRDVNENRPKRQVSTIYRISVYGGLCQNPLNTTNDLHRQRGNALGALTLSPTPASRRFGRMRRIRQHIGSHGSGRGPRSEEHTSELQSIMRN